MMKLFILNANVSAGKNLSFSLINSGGKNACICYTKAFDECGYNVRYIANDDYPDILTEMTVNLCIEKYTNDDESIYMVFEYSEEKSESNKRKRSGGKRSGSKRKNKKTKKIRKIKTRKSRKNKTIKNEYI